MKVLALTILIASLPAGAVIGTCIGLDARAVKWSSRPLALFSLAGLLLVPLLAAGMLAYTGGFSAG